MFAGLSVFSSTTSPLSIGLVHYMAMLMPYLDVPVSQMAADTDQLEDRLAPATSDRTGDNDTQPQVFRVEAVSYFPEWSKSRLQDAQCQDGDIGPIVRWLKGGGKRLMARCNLLQSSN